MKILVGGDFAPCEDIKQMIERGDFSFFNELRKLCKSVDYSIINLEAPIIKSKTDPIAKCGPNLSAPIKTEQSLKFAGVNLVTLANNHIMDYGTSGLSSTLSELRNADISYVGVGNKLSEAKEIKYLNINGYSLAIINCCEHEFSIATNDHAGANPLNPVQQYYSILEAKGKADYVLVIVHGGHEHYQLPSIRMQEVYRFFIDAGADAVINHHQHCYSGYEIYNGKPIFYGLGNLCFDRIGNYPDNWYYGYMVEIDFKKDEIGFSLYPYVQCKESLKVSFLSDKLEFNKKIEELNIIINDSHKLHEAEDKYYDTTVGMMKTLYQPYENRLLNKLYRLHFIPSLVSKQKYLRIFNYINCEAHRDKQLYALKKIIKK